MCFCLSMILHQYCISFNSTYQKWGNCWVFSPVFPPQVLCPWKDQIDKHPLCKLPARLSVSEQAFLLEHGSLARLLAALESFSLKSSTSASLSAVPRPAAIQELLQCSKQVPHFLQHKHVFLDWAMALLVLWCSNKDAPAESQICEIDCHEHPQSEKGFKSAILTLFEQHCSVLI